NTIPKPLQVTKKITQIKVNNKFPQNELSTNCHLLFFYPRIRINNCRSIHLIILIRKKTPCYPNWLIKGNMVCMYVTEGGKNLVCQLRLNYVLEYIKATICYLAQLIGVALQKWLATK